VSAGEQYGGLELLEILVVAVDQELVTRTLEIVSTLCHCIDNHPELPFIRVVVLFVGRAFSGAGIDGVKNPESILLVVDAADCEAA